MPKYDGDLFEPPAPIAYVTLRNQESRAVAKKVPVFLDTGADVTILPRAAVQQISSSESSVDEYELAGFDGTIFKTQAVHLELLFSGKAFIGRYLLYDRDYGLLGRDVLNSLSLTFDGPALEWREARIA